MLDGDIRIVYVIAGCPHINGNMSYCVSHGKDKVIFLTKEDSKKPSSVVLPDDDDEPHGLLLPNGEINWSCPCLGNMITGPCGVEFRESMSCFYKSTAEPKASDCLEKFREMNECMNKYPGLYKKREDEDSGLHNINEEQDESINSSKSVSESNSTVTAETSNLSKQ